MSVINPNRSSDKVTLEECDKIIMNIRIVFEKSIKLGGATIKSFTSSEGIHGLFQNELLVHGKSGSSCGSLIFISRIGGRWTTYCEKCQK